jgi:hypothetical protein
MRFRFSIRDLLWLTALLAVCVAWWVDRHRQVAPAAMKIYPFMALQIDAPDRQWPVNGVFLVSPDGIVNLGPPYFKIKVGGRGRNEFAQTIEKNFKRAKRVSQTRDREELG